MIKDKTKHFRFHFSNEDFYVYFIKDNRKGKIEK